MAKKKKAKRKVFTKTKSKRAVKRVEGAAKRVGKKAKRGAKRLVRKAKPFGKKVKRGAKRVGRKAKGIAKTDMGRAGIGAGAGALLLGPVGAVAGAAAGLATRKPRKRRRNVSAFEPGKFERIEPLAEEVESSRVMHRPSPGSRLARAGLRDADWRRLAQEETDVANPEPKVKIASVMGSLLLDYQKASPAIEHVTASALRGERVELSIVKRARADLHSLHRLQKQDAEREQIEDLVDALDRLISKGDRSVAKKNPARTFSLEAQVKQGRQSRAKKAAMGIASESKVYEEIGRKSTAARLREINPKVSHAQSSMLDELADDYRKSRKRWLATGMRSSSTEGEVARAKKRMDDAENKLVMYAEISNMSPDDLKTYMKHSVQMQKRARRAAKLKPAGNPKKRSSKLTKIPKGVKIKRLSPGRAEGAELPGEWISVKYSQRAVPKGIGVRASNSGKPATKRATTPEWQRLTRRCQKLWEHYCERPGKDRLKNVFKHLKTMEGNASQAVNEERARCMRASKAEAKRLKLKV